ncbi:MAG: chloride channel protein [Thermoprotei archaeon]|nr:chloride channel protein [Thermoprotei archaeon]
MHEIHDFEALLKLEKWALYSALVGIVAGMGAVAFDLLTSACETFFLRILVNYSHEMLIENPSLEFRWYLLPFITGVGGLLSGLLVYGLAPEAGGHGVNAVIRSLHQLSGLIHRKVVLVKMLASAITIGSGGSAGKLGPVAQVSAGLSSWLAHMLRAIPYDRRIMVMCGVASGIGAMFRAPLGAAFFAIEVLYRRDFESEALIPAIISSIVAYTVYILFMGTESAFYVPRHEMPSVYNFPLYALLGVVTGFVAILYVRLFYGMRNLIFKNIPAPKALIPMIGGILTGIVGIFYPHILGTGYEWIELAILGRLSLDFMLILILTKMLTTSLTLGSGGSGGVFAPLLFIGAMIGGTFGALLQGFIPGTTSSISHFAIVGMASFFAAAAKVPLASIVMIVEMTRGYEMLVPTIIASVLAYVISGELTIYESQVLSKERSPFHTHLLIKRVLRHYKVESVMTTNYVAFKPYERVIDVIMKSIKVPYGVFPVIQGGRLVGAVIYGDLIKLISKETRMMPIVKVMKKNVPIICPNETLDKALDEMLSYGMNVVMVVDSISNMKLMGIVTRSNIMELLWRRSRRAS